MYMGQHINSRSTPYPEAMHRDPAYRQDRSRMDMRGMESRPEVSFILKISLTNPFPYLTLQP